METPRGAEELSRWWREPGDRNHRTTCSRNLSPEGAALPEAGKHRRFPRRPPITGRPHPVQKSGRASFYPAGSYSCPHSCRFPLISPPGRRFPGGFRRSAEVISRSGGVFSGRGKVLSRSGGVFSGGGKVLSRPGKVFSGGCKVLGRSGKVFCGKKPRIRRKIPRIRPPAPCLRAAKPCMPRTHATTCIIPEIRGP